jgi:hypothetical protein
VASAYVGGRLTLAVAYQSVQSTWENNRQKHP